MNSLTPHPARPSSQSGRFFTRDPAFWAGGSGNLYVYGRNDPTRFVDVTGFFSIEGSAYAGIGGGAKLTADPETGDASVCLEVGLGFGGGSGFDPGDTDVAKGGTSVKAEVEASAGPFSAKLGGELDTDGCFTNTSEVSAGPVSVDSEGDVSLSQKEGDWTSIFDDLKLEFQAKIAGQHCFSTK